MRSWLPRLRVSQPLLWPRHAHSGIKAVDQVVKSPETQGRRQPHHENVEPAPLASIPAAPRDRHDSGPWQVPSHLRVAQAVAIEITFLSQDFRQLGGTYGSRNCC